MASVTQSSFPIMPSGVTWRSLTQAVIPGQCVTIDPKTASLLVHPRSISFTTVWSIPGPGSRLRSRPRPEADSSTFNGLFRGKAIILGRPVGCRPATSGPSPINSTTRQCYVLARPLLLSSGGERLHLPWWKSAFPAKCQRFLRHGRQPGGTGQTGPVGVTTQSRAFKNRRRGRGCHGRTELFWKSL